MAERDSLVAERDSLVAERDSLVAKTDSLVAERDAARAERDELKAQLAEMHQKAASTVAEGECWAAPSLPWPLIIVNSQKEISNLYVLRQLACNIP